VATPNSPTPVPAPAPAAAPAAAVALAEPDAQAGDDALDLEGLRALWPAVLDTVRDRNEMLAALLDGANPVALAGDELTVAFSESAAFLKRKAEDATNRDALARAIQTVSGRTVRLVYELRPDAGERPASGDQAGQLSDEELVARFMAEFDAEELPAEEETGGS
jgi:DNA polymerase-3 subunit gamma/tau